MIYRNYYFLISLLILFSCSDNNTRDTPGEMNTIQVIFPGDYPDPSILKDGEDYYLTHSSFEHYPGLLIWHSKDLKQWKPVVRALTKYTGSVYAPDLIKYRGKYYIYFPGVTVENGWKVYVITADNIKGPWSDPVLVGDFWAIDPGFITDENGKPYLHLNEGRVVELSEDGLTSVGDVRYTYEGWPIPEDYGIECFCLESPKLLFKDGYYYLTSAQGGTAGPSTSHAVVSARSKTPTGPWENNPYNPVIRTWNSLEPWMSKGHGTLFEGPGGQWYVVYHAYERGYYTLGRQTLIEPVTWTSDGWFKRTISDTFNISYEKTYNTAISSDNFSSPVPKLQWTFFGNNSYQSASLEDGQLILQSEKEDMTVIHCFVPDHNYTAQAEVDPQDGVEVGIAAFYNKSHYVGIAIKDGKVYTTRDGKPGIEIEAEDARFLKMEMQNHDLKFQYSSDGLTWQYHPYAYEVSTYNHNALGEFLALKTAIWCSGPGQARIDNFIYSPGP